MAGLAEIEVFIVGFFKFLIYVETFTAQAKVVGLRSERLYPFDGYWAGGMAMRTSTTAPYWIIGHAFASSTASS